MIGFFISLLTFFNAFFRSRCILGLEILALRQQLGVCPHARCLKVTGADSLMVQGDGL